MNSSSTQENQTATQAERERCAQLVESYMPIAEDDEFWSHNLVRIVNQIRNGDEHQGRFGPAEEE